jgi:hypothetical protein
MTIGDDLQDFRVLTPQIQGGSILAGSYWHRKWSGGDQSTPPERTRTGETGNIRKTWDRPPKRGRLGEHPYSCRIDSILDNMGRYTAYDGNPRDNVASSMGVPVFDSYWSSDNDYALLDKLRRKVMGSTINFGVAIAEGGDSLRMIFEATRALDGAIRHARRGDFVSAWKSVTRYKREGVRRNVSSNWLQLQYGIRPLLSDIHDAATSLAHFLSVPLRQVITVERKVGGVVRNNLDHPWVTGYEHTSGFEVVKYKAILEEVNAVKLLGLSDPASIIWEKLPFSFVFDWIIPVGDFLQARGLAQSLTGTFVKTRTVKWEAKHPTYKKVVDGVLFNPSGGLLTYSKRVVTVSRVIQTSLDVPLPSIQPLSRAIGWERAANAVALFMSQKHARVV